MQKAWGDEYKVLSPDQGQLPKIKRHLPPGQVTCRMLRLYEEEQSMPDP